MDTDTFITFIMLALLWILLIPIMTPRKRIVVKNYTRANKVKPKRVRLDNYFV